MSHPYQCLFYCHQANQNENGILVVASGPYIHTLSAKNGKYLSTWPSFEIIAQTRSVGQNNGNELEVPHQDNSRRPSKRQKLSPARDEPGSSSVEIVVAGDSDNGELASSLQPSSPPAIKLAGTSTGQHVVAVTGEDKCIRVFDLAANGTLTQLSERAMPKRPCAVALTPDDATILCADKFGDVYSLPLVGEAYESEAVNGIDATSDTSHHKQKQKLFAPSATSLTVHTKRNRDALRQQQTLRNNPKTEKKALNFDHKLLLGHVSLLTDVACVTLASPSQKPRNYILTSDRDEHIRVSRGIPQAHIVEGYCLGHTEFLTKLCVPPVYPHLLISGGGDDYLILWDWSTGRMLQQLDLKNLVANLKNTYLGARSLFSGSAEIKDTETEVDGALTICVSNIQALETHKESSSDRRVEIIVTCEGVPALFTFTLGANAQMAFNASIHTESNVIDLAVLRDQSSVVYSMDTCHQAFSTKASADTKKQSSSCLVGSLSFCVDSNTWKEDHALQGNLVAATRECTDSHLHIPQVGAAKGTSLTELLYGLGSLRKRGSDNETDV